MHLAKPGVVLPGILNKRTDCVALRLVELNAMGLDFVHDVANFSGVVSLC